MKKILLIIAAAFLICFSAVGAQAFTSPFFAYDDFKLVFGAPGNPGSAGGVFTSDGKVLEVSNPLDVIGWFVIEGTTSGAQAVGTQYMTEYVGTLKIYQDQSHTIVLWSGLGDVTTIVNADSSVFPAIYPRPAGFTGQPTNYNSIGDGSYTGSGSGGFAAVDKLNIDWLGTYNWTYNISSGGQITTGTTEQYGNAQGGLSVPEPLSVLLLGLGLVGIAGIRRKFKISKS